MGESKPEVTTVGLVPVIVHQGQVVTMDVPEIIPGLNGQVRCSLEHSAPSQGVQVNVWMSMEVLP